MMMMLAAASIGRQGMVSAQPRTDGAAPGTAQPADHAALMKAGDYRRAAEEITKKLNAIYEKRVEDKRIPTSFITMKKVEEGVSLKELFRTRRVAGLFIENNAELFSLHHDAAACYNNLGETDKALNHYYQSLRFKTLEPQKDDVIFHEIAQVYKKMKRREPYQRMLEAAYAFNPERIDYSLELGVELTNTTRKKKAIFHLERYIAAKGDDADPALHLRIGNLSEDIGRYLDTAASYQKYLAKKPDDGRVHFALGYLAYRRTGNHTLAAESFKKSLELLPPNDTYRRSKANEYLGDIYRQDLEFDKALDVYRETMSYQKQILADIDKKKQEILKVREDIKALKSGLIKTQDFDEYNKYEISHEERGKLELDNREKRYEYGKLNPGRVAWNMAEIHERAGRYAESIEHYRQAITFNHDATRARDRIVKLQLKIKRGY